MLLRAILVLSLVALLLGSGASFAADLEVEVDLVLGSDDDQEAYIIGSPSSVVESFAGDIFVGDSRQMKVLRFTESGEFLGYLGKTGDGPTDLMRRFCLAIDSEDKIYIVGQGRRVEVVDLEWNYLESFERENAGSVAWGLSVQKEGGVIISSPNTSDQTVLAQYDPSWTYIRSFSNTFAVETDFPSQYERNFAGGHVTIGPSDEVFYSQRAPYEIRLFTKSGELIKATSQGGEGFVDPPQKPKVEGDRVGFFSNSSTTGIATLGSGGVLVTATPLSEGGERSSLLCLYDYELNLVGSRVVEGLMSLIGKSTGGRAYFLRESETGKEVVRAKVGIANP